jgi:hypothetical protein
MFAGPGQERGVRDRSIQIDGALAWTQATSALHVIGYGKGAPDAPAGSVSRTMHVGPSMADAEVGSR